VQFEEGDDENAPVYDVLLTKIFRRGRFTIGASGGWAENFLEARRRGLTRFYGADGTIDYQLLELLSLYARGFYRLDRNRLNLEEENWRGSVGLTWAFLRYFALSLDYSYAERNADALFGFDYKVNRVMLRFTAGKLYRW
jgi:hypothetical protein